MSVARIASRYAKSLLDLSIEQNKLDTILGDINTLQETVKNRDFYLMLKSPIINSGKKGSAFKALFADRFDPMSMRFLDIVLNKGREPFLPEIANEFVAQYKDYKKVSTIKVTSAVPLSASAIEKIKAKFLQSKATKESIEVETIIDPAIIGGLIVEFEDKLYDSSVAHKLDLLKKEFTGNLYKSKM